MMQRVFFGRVNNPKNKGLKDLSWREIGLLAPLLFLMVYMGVYPAPFLNKSKEAVVSIQQRVVGGEKGGSFEKAEVHSEVKK
jgi:NADH-quinone oxidoreductase subunit M